MSFTSFAEGTRWPDLYAAAACAFLAGTAMFTVQFSLALHFQSTGRGGTAVAMLIICITLPLVLLSPITGRMADRFDSRALMAGSGVLQAAAIAGMTVTDDFAALLALAVVNAAGTALLQPTVAALVPVIATRDDLPRATAIVQTGTLIGLASGPASAGFLVGAYGLDTALWVAAAAAALRALVSCDIRTRRGGVRRARAAASAQAPTWNLRSDRLITAMVVGLVAAIGALAAVNVLEVFLVREVYAAPEALYGTINATWTVGMAIGAWVAAAVIGRMTRDGQLAMLLMTALLGTGAVCAVLGLPLPTVFLLIPLYFLGGIFNSLENNALGISIARRVPEHLRGRASARISALIHASTLGGFALGGFLSTFLGTRTSFLLLGLFTIAAVGACLPMVRAAARADDSADEPVAVAPQLAGAR